MKLTKRQNDLIYILGGIFSFIVSVIITTDPMEIVLFTVIGVFCFTGYWFYVIVGKYEKWINGELTISD